MPISKVVYGNQVVIDITDTTATPSDVMYGKYFYMPDGSRVEGTGSGGGGVVVVETTDEHGGTIVDITGEVIRLQTKTATPSSEQIYVTPDSGYIGLSSVTVQAIPSEYVKPTGTISITQNGITNVAGYASANVNVQPSVSLQSKSVNPSESAQTVTADAGYTALSTVYVGAVSSTYVGSGVTRRAASDLVADGSVVNVPSGYYQAAASTAIGKAEMEDQSLQHSPTISVSNTGVISAVNNHTAAVFPITWPGYVDISDDLTIACTGSSSYQLTTQAAKTVTPSESTQTAVASGRYTTGAVTVGAISSTYVGSGITRRSASDLTASGSVVTVPSGYYSAQATKAVAAATHPAPSISVSAAGLITASHTQAAGYVTAGTSTATQQLTTQAAATITPSTSAQTAVASGRYTTGVVTVAAIPAQYKDISGVTATASDVVTGKSFVNSTGTVNGSLVIQHYYTGSGVPSAALGNNGDIYLKTS